MNKKSKRQQMETVPMVRVTFDVRREAVDSWCDALGIDIDDLPRFAVETISALAAENLQGNKVLAVSDGQIAYRDEEVFVKASSVRALDFLLGRNVEAEKALHTQVIFPDALTCFQA